MTSFLAIASAKGGVGKTTTAIQLAKAFAYLQHSVVLVDLNLHKPNIGIYCNLHDHEHSIHSLLSTKEHHPTEAMIEHDTIRVIQGGSDETLLHTEFGTSDIEYILSQLVTTADIVIIDTPSGLSRETKNVLKACDNILLLTTVDDASIADTNRTSTWLKSQQKHILGVVVNKKTTQLKKIQEQLQDSIIGSIPALTNVKNEHPSYRTIAANLIGQTYEYTEPQSILTYIGQRLRILKR